MQQIPREQVSRRFQVLPQALQDAIFSDRTTDIILKYCTLREVSHKQTYVVGALSTQVLLGYLRPETFAFEIQKETGIDALKATQVAHDIDTEIFSEVRLELKKLYPPTIQTPTVQSQGFVRSQPIAAEPPKPAPRYVVPIPERFKKTAPWPQPTADTSKLTIQNEASARPSPAAPPIADQKPSSPIASPEAFPEQGTPQPPAQKVPSQPVSPPMDPVVPLPTFIQSKFTNTASPETRVLKSDVQDSNKNDALKNAFGKFTVSSTAPEVKKEPLNPYREAIEEPKNPPEQKPAAKNQGKVIDLSQF